MSKLIKTALKESVEGIKPIYSDIQDIVRDLNRVKKILTKKVFNVDSDLLGGATLTPQNLISEPTTQEYGLILQIIDDVFPQLEQMKQAAQKSINWQLAVIDELEEREQS